MQVTDKYYARTPERVININGTTYFGKYRLSKNENYYHTYLQYYCMVKKEKTCLLIDIAIADDSNVSTKETEKLSKYNDLEIEVGRMWKVRSKVVPVTT